MMEQRIMLIGREDEHTIFSDATKTGHLELTTIYDRRRICKTYLIRSEYEERMIIELSDMQRDTPQKQLKYFHLKLWPRAAKTSVRRSGRTASNCFFVPCYRSSDH